jgi:hypothetical protein
LLAFVEKMARQIGRDYVARTAKMIERDYPGSASKLVPKLREIYRSCGR